LLGGLVFMKIIIGIKQILVIVLNGGK
ncbi:uncharacterized protein METZ01_LOCUS416835, partial [marine metagenome]